MKALRIVSIIVLVILTLFSIVYAQIQTGYMVENKLKAEANMKEIEKQKRLVETHAARANEEAVYARLAQQKAEEYHRQLQECQSKK